MKVSHKDHLLDAHQHEIDSLINDAIQNNMTPGAQLLIAKNSNIIYHKAYGYKTYEKKEKITNNNIYDLASLTKILVSVPLLMNEFMSNDFDLTTKLSDWFPEKELNNKKDLTLKQLFSHICFNINSKHMSPIVHNIL